MRAETPCARNFPPKGPSENSVDTKTRHALKQDRFVTATTSGLEWIDANRAGVIRWAIAAVVVLGLLVAGLVVWHQRSQAADQLLGQAMDIYQTPLALPGEPQPPGQKTYVSAADRAAAAYPLFEKAATQYGWFRAGQLARYFAGVTAVDLGKTADAETELEKASHSGDSSVAALAKLALANLYAQDGRTSQAALLFQELIAHPTTTVPKSAARLQLAQMFETTDPSAAKRIYAQIEDQDKDTDAAQIAAQRLQKLK
jgi:predicted negative regulator of RcsB-dependent stress response